MSFTTNTVYVLQFDYWADTDWASADGTSFFAGLYPDNLPSRYFFIPKKTLQKAYVEMSSSSPDMANALLRFVSFGPSKVYVANVLFYAKNTLGMAAVDVNPFRYCGEYWDRETGTYYLRARYYEPGTGRFLSEDSAHDGLNYYTYCYNNPGSYVDPSGHSALGLLLTAATVLVTAAVAISAISST